MSKRLGGIRVLQRRLFLMFFSDLFVYPPCVEVVSIALSLPIIILVCFGNPLGFDERAIKGPSQPVEGRINISHFWTSLGMSHEHTGRCLNPEISGTGDCSYYCTVLYCTVL